MEEKTIKVELSKSTPNYYRYVSKDKNIIITMYISKEVITTETVPMTLQIAVRE